MHNVHNTKCLCGKGIAHAHFDNYSNFHSWLTCPECSRKYHAHVFGLLPRHIPVKYPKDNIQKEIDRIQFRLRRSEPMYVREDINAFMTDEEKDVVYGESWRTDPIPIVRYYTEEGAKIGLMQRCMREAAYRFSQYELLRMHDHMDDSIYDEAVEKLMQKYRTLTEAEMQQCLRRAIIDYKRHKEAQSRWFRSREEEEARLHELLMQQKQQRDDLERQWKLCVIPWEELEEISEVSKK